MMTVDKNHAFLAQLKKQQQQKLQSIPKRKHVFRFTKKMVNFLFPINSSSKLTLEKKYQKRKKDLFKLLRLLKSNANFDSNHVVNYFFSNLQKVYEYLLEDINSVIAFDPASTCEKEVVAAYPGFFAITAYRLAHLLYQKEVPILPRMITEYAHTKTGIDIHPGATIGRSFFIDHGTGIVIGETSIIGNNVKIYQGVTIGATSVKKKFAKTKRHPTVEDEVTIYANSTILGGSTTIGKGSIISGNTLIKESIEPYSRVYPKNNRILVLSSGERP